MAQPAEAGPRMLDTGVPNLDLVLGGGLQVHNSYIIAGPSGAGKSVLSEQIIFHRAKLGDRILLLTGLDEPHQNLLEHMRTFSFADTSLVGPTIETVSLVPFLDEPLAEKISILRRTVLSARPRIVALDGLRSFEAFTDGEQGSYQFIYGLTSWFAVEGITLLMTREVPGEGWPEIAEFSLVDGVLQLERALVNDRSVRRLWVRKMRGQKPLPGLHTYTVDANGVTVWPRPQALFQPEDRSVPGTRLAFGVPTLDPLLGGGLPEATSTLLAGDPGAGMAALAMAFLRGGAQQGQPGLWLSLRESPSRLLAMSRQWGVDLTEAEDRGQVRLLAMAPFELEADRLAAVVQANVAEMGAKRLVLDAAEALDVVLPLQHDAPAFLAWLLRYLPQQGVTALITRHEPAPPGRPFDASGLPLAYLYDNIMLVRQVQEPERLRRALAIVGMSSPGYQATVRELVLDGKGIVVGEPLSGEEETRQPALRASGEPVRGPA